MNEWMVPGHAPAWISAVVNHLWRSWRMALHRIFEPNLYHPRELLFGWAQRIWWWAIWILLAKAMEIRNFRERDGSACGGSEIAFVTICHCASKLAHRAMTTIIMWNIRASGIRFVWANTTCHIKLPWHFECLDVGNSSHDTKTSRQQDCVPFQVHPPWH